MKDCLFCKIVNNEVPSKVIYEDEDIKMMLDAYPDTDGHTLIIPKKHYEDILELPNEVLDKMFDIARKYTPVLMEKLDKDAMTLIFNYGEAQAIKHVHLHLLPNYNRKTHAYSNDEVLEILTKE